MAINPFEGLITNDLKNNFKLAISEVIRSCEISCRLYFPITKYTACSACAQGITLQSPNPYLGGQRGKFTTSCNVCNGTNKIPVENYEDIDLCVIWDTKKSKEIAGILIVPEGDVQTFCNIGLIEQIKSCNYAIFDTTIQALNKTQYSRSGEPRIMGFGESSFILTPWKVSS